MLSSINWSISVIIELNLFEIVLMILKATSKPKITSSLGFLTQSLSETPYQRS